MFISQEETSEYYIVCFVCLFLFCFFFSFFFPQVASRIIILPSIPTMKKTHVAPFSWFQQYLEGRQCQVSQSPTPKGATSGMTITALRYGSTTSAHFVVEMLGLLHNADGFLGGRHRRPPHWSQCAAWEAQIGRHSSGLLPDV